MKETKQTYSEEDLKRIEDAIESILKSFSDLKDDMRAEFTKLNTRLDKMIDKEE
ncbi:MAG: hypothetical protein ACQEWW_16870 [Bacillota bacterium]